MASFEDFVHVLKEILIFFPTFFCFFYIKKQREEKGKRNILKCLGLISLMKRLFFRISSRYIDKTLDIKFLAFISSFKNVLQLDVVKNELLIMKLV